MVPSYGPLKTKQLLSETFFSPGLGFRDIRLDGLKWATLYIYKKKGKTSRIITLSSFQREFAPNKEQLLCRISKENLHLIKGRREESE